GSSRSRWLVAAMMTSSRTGRHSSSDCSSWVTTRLLSSLMPSSRRSAIASNSSKNSSTGTFRAASANTARRLRLDSPTNLEIRSDVDTCTKPRPNSPAVAFARNVLPTPGGPCSSTPLTLILYVWASPANASSSPNVSASSAFSASIPPTSANVGSSPAGCTRTTGAALRPAVAATGSRCHGRVDDGGEPGGCQGCPCGGDGWYGITWY